MRKMTSLQVVRGIVGVVMGKSSLTAVLMLAAVALFACQAQAIDIATVRVGNTGNSSSPSGNPDKNRGAVDYVYHIGKYPVTAGEYTAYLNAVAKSDPNAVYDEPRMNPNHADGPQIARSGSSGSYQYTVAAEFENRPMNYVNFPRILRFANWLHNDQPAGAQDGNSTENGAYDVNESIWSMERKPDWKWAVASIDEWVKAGYHKNNGNTGDYWLYPTSSDDRPGYVTENDVDAAGKVIAADPGNTATWNGDAPDSSGIVGIGAPWFRTEVGEHENSASPYGTFDQGGNVWEMTDSFSQSTERIRRGGNYEHGTKNGYMQTNFSTNYSPADSKGNRVTGFRVVSNIPEPGSLILLLGGTVGVLLSNVRRTRRNV